MPLDNENYEHLKFKNLYPSLFCSKRMRLVKLFTNVFYNLQHKPPEVPTSQTLFTFGNNQITDHLQTM